MEPARRSFAAFAAFCGPTVLWLVVFFLIPVGIVWMYSFGENISLTEIETTWTWSNYSRVFDEEILVLVWRTLRLALITTAICLVIGYPIALVIATAEPRWKPWLLLVIILPFWTNLLIRTFAINQIIRNEGVLNTFLLWLGAIDEPLVIIYTDFAVFLGMTYVYLPLMVLPLFAAIDRFDMRLLEAAYDLYASRWQVLRRIVVPVVKPGIIAGSILVFIPSLGAFVTPRLLGGGQNMMIGNFIELQFGAGRNWPLGAALSVTLLVIVAVALMIYIRFANRDSGHG